MYFLNDHFKYWWSSERWDSHIHATATTDRFSLDPDCLTAGIHPCSFKINTFRYIRLLLYCSFVLFWEEFSPQDFAVLASFTFLSSPTLIFLNNVLLCPAFVRHSYYFFPNAGCLYLNIFCLSILIPVHSNATLFRDANIIFIYSVCSFISKRLINTVYKRWFDASELI